MRVVLDTNVLISAFLWRKHLYQIYAAIRENKITPSFNEVTWAELHRVLSYKKLEDHIAIIGITPDEIVDLLLQRSHFVFAQPEITVIQDDESDNHILACAIVARASFIISGDQHLLRIKKFKNIPVLTPKQFLKIIKFR